MDGNTSSDRILKNLTDYFEKVGHDERSCLIRQLEGVLRRLICRNIREDVPPDVSCPWCQGHTYVRYGLTKTGRQRYRCGNCRRTFSDGSVKNFLTSSGLPAEAWLRFCGCFANLYSLRKCARICDVSLNTSFFMRRAFWRCFSPNYLLSEQKQEWTFRSMRSTSGIHTKGLTVMEGSRAAPEGAAKDRDMD